jgi:hypothetical protein
MVYFYMPDVVNEDAVQTCNSPGKPYLFLSRIFTHVLLVKPCKYPFPFVKPFILISLVDEWISIPTIGGKM